MIRKLIQLTSTARFDPIKMQQAIVYDRYSSQGIKVSTIPLPHLPLITYSPSFESNPHLNVLIQVEACGINPVDVKGVIGDKLPDMFNLRDFSRRFIDSHVPGFDFCGRIAQLPIEGDYIEWNRRKYKVGDYVYGTVPPLVGSFQEFVAAPLNQIALMPSNISRIEASAVPLVALTALQGLTKCSDCHEGTNLLVIGASGGVGHIIVQIGKVLGARVTAICGEKNLEFVSESLHADHAVDYSLGSDEIKAALRTIVERDGKFDIIFDTVSSNEKHDKAMGYSEMMTDPSDGFLDMNKGKYLHIGGETTDWMKAGLKRTIGIDLFSPKKELVWVQFPNSSEQLYQINEWIEQGLLKVHISGVCEFNEESIRQAFQEIRSRHVVGKLVLRVISE